MGTHGSGFGVGGAWRCCARRLLELHVAKAAAAGAPCSAVVVGISGTGVLAARERFLVRRAGDEIGAPAALPLHDGQGSANVGAVAEAAALGLEVAEDCGGVRMAFAAFHGEGGVHGSMSAVLIELQ